MLLKRLEEVYGKQSIYLSEYLENTLIQNISKYRFFLLIKQTIMAISYSFEDKTVLINKVVSILSFF